MSEDPTSLERDQVWSVRSEGSVPAGVMLAVSRALLVASVASFAAMAPALGAAGEGLTLSDAWVPAAPEVGRDIPLLITIKNDTTAPEALMRVRCPIANFSERHTVDRGEGAPAMRSIPNIPIAAGSTLVLLPTAYHVMLLQTREPLEPGKRFTCTIVFQKAGSIETEVEVRKSP
ncbi:MULTISPECIES: copper chaperone PCu(A)C [unclassified Bradyrhizobium]|uniref:copper chaperone PCu(A)C n=2 Tax=unclassified Bradyrhizobium TaxID=2631580 RepID=UPI0028F00405|nr:MULTISPECIES: copper chaperone PCu(A)C [unclassified Bradyrhizobium]